MIMHCRGFKCRWIPHTENAKIPDEKALCLGNPEYSCVTCMDTECPDFGTRFASCPEHIFVE